MCQILKTVLLVILLTDVLSRLEFFRGNYSFISLLAQFTSSTPTLKGGVAEDKLRFFSNQITPITILFNFYLPDNHVGYNCSTVRHVFELFKECMEQFLQ